jgi:uncharacterized membrane protein SpoIIM required for sporulation
MVAVIVAPAIALLVIMGVNAPLHRNWLATLLKQDRERRLLLLLSTMLALIALV